ncbi:MAG: hypothetical protein K8T10_13605 [Candidatus Eremiobacteraeota bacterium]|nr:hypothetical protein [Candidatus Eremiobacteraeota bacterium]
MGISSLRRATKRHMEMSRGGASVWHNEIIVGLPVYRLFCPDDDYFLADDYCLARDHDHYWAIEQNGKTGDVTVSWA